MPQQLIYTSAPRGLVAGRSGHCTVARSAAMREPLMLRLEQLSYYHHLSLTGGRDRPIFAYRIIDIRGSRFHVLSRIKDAGLDFTGRTNFIAHHLALPPEELRQFSTSPVILRDWTGWVNSWTKEPQLLENEDWSGLKALTGKTSLPAQTWQRVTGDAVNGYGLLDARSGTAFRTDGLAEADLLGLFAESLELLEVRDARRDFRTASWQYTFTTSMQEQDNPGDFRWRCIYSDNPAVSRFMPPDCRPLAELRANKWSGEEVALAQTGRQPPRFLTEPQDVKITEGGAARFQARAEGIPNPSYQWFSVDRANNGQILASETSPDLELKNPPFGVSRYIVRASNSAGEIASKVATLSVEQKLRLASVRTDAQSSDPAKVVPYQKSDEDIERQRKRLQAEQAQAWAQKRSRRNKIVLPILTVALITVGMLAGRMWLAHRKLPTIARPLAVHTDTLSIDVNATGAPTLNYLWYYTDCKAITNLISSATSSNLTINITSSANEFSYFVVITNTFGAVTSGVVRFMINKGPDPQTQVPGTNQNGSSNALPKQTLLDNFSIPAKQKLPNGWVQQAIGNVRRQVVLYRTNAQNKNALSWFDLTTDAEGFLDNGDNLLFVYKTNIQTEFAAALFTQTNDSVFPMNGMCGIMIRESTNSKSLFLFIGRFGSDVVVRCRDAYDLQPYKIIGTMANPAVCLKIYATNNTFAAAYKFGNDQNYIPVPLAIPKADKALFGFALGSGSTDQTVTTHFRCMPP